MVTLDTKGTSEIIEHAEYATEVDSYNILARIPYLGLRIPLKCFRAWALLSKRKKFARHAAALHVGAMHLRPRAFRVLSRLCTIVDQAEQEALAGALTLLPSAAIDVETLADAGTRAPGSLEFDAVVDAHCETLREKMRSLIQQVAMVIDEEWVPLNWMQDMPPVEETEESQERRMKQQETDAAIDRFQQQQERAKRVREQQQQQQNGQPPPPPQPPTLQWGQTGGSSFMTDRPNSAGGLSVSISRLGSSMERPRTAGSVPPAGGGSAAEMKLNMKMHGPSRPVTASRMPPPPRGGHPAPMVEWKNGRLTQARILNSAVRGLPRKAVADVQRTFTFATLSTGGIDQTAKNEAKEKLESEVTTQRLLTHSCPMPHTVHHCPMPHAHSTAAPCLSLSHTQHRCPKRHCPMHAPPAPSLIAGSCVRSTGDQLLAGSAGSVRA